MDDDPLQKKSFWWTLGIGSVLMMPNLIVPIATGGALYFAAKGTRAAARGTSRVVGNAVGGIVRGLRERAARKRAEAEYERGAPERERIRRQLEAAALARTIAQRRREDMRTRCELIYLHYPTIAPHLPRKRFDHFMATRMGDDQPPEKVEERGRDLQRLLRQLGEQPAPPAGTEEYLHWCREQILRTAALPLDLHIQTETMAGLQRSLLATEQLLAARRAQTHTQARLDVQVAELHRRHEANVTALRNLQGIIDEALFQDLLQTERRRFRNELLDMAEGQQQPGPPPVHLR